MAVRWRYQPKENVLAYMSGSGYRRRSTVPIRFNEGRYVHAVLPLPERQQVHTGVQRVWREEVGASATRNGSASLCRRSHLRKRFQCVPLWPSQKCKRKTLEVRYEGQDETCRPFPITENFEGFCQIENDVRLASNFSAFFCFL